MFLPSFFRAFTVYQTAPCFFLYRSEFQKTHFLLFLPVLFRISKDTPFPVFSDTVTVSCKTFPFFPVLLHVVKRHASSCFFRCQFCFSSILPFLSHSFCLQRNSKGIKRKQISVKTWYRFRTGDRRYEE